MSVNVIEQVRLMLAKAESTTPAEAEMIMARAEKLMLRHGLDEAMLSATKRKEKIVLHRMSVDGIFADGRVRSAALIAEAFGTLRALISGYKGHWTLYIVGHESDIKHAVMIIDSLMLQAIIAEKAWRTGEGKRELSYLPYKDAWKARRQFHMSFGRGAAHRIQETLREVVSETVSETGTPGAELVLVGRKEVVEGAVDSFFPSTRTSRGLNGSYAGREAGYRAGRNADVGSSKVAIST